jgi:Glycosyltransferase family 87
MTAGLLPEKARWIKPILILLLVVYALTESVSGRNDWDIFIAASRDLFEGVDLYATTYFDGYHYYYSLFFATLLYPFTLVPAAVGKFVWVCLNMAMIAAVLRSVWMWFDWQGISIQAKRWVFVLIFLGTLRFLKSNVHLGQTTILLLFLSLEALHLDERKKEWSAGLLLSLAINIKLLPAVLLPYWMYRARWKSVVIAGTCIMLWWLLPAAWLGAERTSTLMHSYVELINPAQDKHVLDVEETSFHGLSTLLSTLFSSHAHEHNGPGWKRNIADCSMETLSILINAARLFFVLFILYFLRTLPFKSATSSLHRAWELSYVLLVIPLIAPHQQHYAFLFALPAIAYVSYFLLVIKPKRAVMLWSAFLVAMVSFNLALWLGAFNVWYNHYKILTYGALILVVLLALLVPPVEKEKVGTSPTFH